MKRKLVDKMQESPILRFLMLSVTRRHGMMRLRMVDLTTAAQTTVGFKMRCPMMPFPQEIAVQMERP